MEIMQRMKSGLGYAWAALCFVVILATFLGMGFWERALARGTAIHVTPRFSGGEVLRTIDHGSYRTLLHRPVFDGLIGERSGGFVQIDWVPREKQTLPPIVEEDFDINGDASIEISVRIDTTSGRIQLLPKAPWVLDPEPLIAVDSERILRVRLRNPRAQ